ncbi:unnamed protein product [Urochloa decumbens]|uniref:DUF6598 domain-containing protein n=1 Tax=Urochloa decumbens TaxID=240449 RepID=A0ABC9F665_9POAL
MAFRRRFTPSYRAFLRQGRRSTSFNGDFGLDDLFHEHIESAEEEDVDSDDDDDEMGYIEPLLYDEKMEALWVAEKAEMLKRAAEEKAREAERLERQAEEKERNAERLERCRKKHDAVIKSSIRRYDPKAKCLVWTRFPFEDFSSFDLDEESPVPPMQYTNKTYQTECSMNCSANILSVKVVSSDVGFPIHVYGSVIARDSMDNKCVYLFRCHRRDSQLIKSEDESLILTGPARGLLLIDFIFLETDLKIKGERGQDKLLSRGLLQIDGRILCIREDIKVRGVTCASRLSTVEVNYVVVKSAVEATIEIQVPHGKFYGEITAHTTSILHRIVLYDSKAGGVAMSDNSGAIQLWCRVIAVCLNEKLMLTVDTEASNGIQTIQFIPSLNGANQHVIYCGATKLCLKVTWLVITE